MTTNDKTHRKHARLKRLSFGEYARHELAILGSSCEKINDLVSGLISDYADRFQLGFLDADHQALNSDLKPVLLSKGARKRVLFKQSFEEVSQNISGYSFDRHFLYHSLDVLLINGNHFKASAQLIIADDKKRDSLERHVDRLSAVEAVYLPEGRDTVPDWLKNLIPEDQTYTILHDTLELTEWFGAFLRLKQPVLHGLVLSGGKSVRMGEDKSLLNYHGLPQFEYMAHQLNEVCKDVYISVRPGQTLDTTFPLISDKFIDLGPYGAILSAFMTDPEAAWLVLATDLPLINVKELDHLIHHRQSGKLATAFHNSTTGLPDPLCTIWEPRAYQRMLQFLSTGHSCPRKVLINSDIALIEPLNPESLRNVNTRQEKDALLQQLQSQQK